MSYVVKKLPPVETEVLEAAVWYDERQKGLGQDFLYEVDRALRALTGDALLHRIRFADVRRAPVPRFKFYGVYYIVRQNEGWVLAVFHGRRHPRLLGERLGQLG